MPQMFEDPDALFDTTDYTTWWRLDERFGVPPFSVLSTRDARWMRRRRKWAELDMASEQGRDEKLLFNVDKDGSDAQRRIAEVGHSTSVFDPVLAEIVLRWWSPAGARVYDPFAGGSVRGVVAAVLGREYFGVDLSERQVAANYESSDRLGHLYPGPKPTWHVGDSSEFLPEPESFDFVLSCPPYGGLEKYTDDPLDLSNMEQDQFEAVYRQCIANALRGLKDNRFACFVVGNYREGEKLVDLVGMTVKAFEDAGASYYADNILLNVAGSAGLRSSYLFPINRKPTRVHQYALTFVKGDWREAVASVEDIDPVQEVEEIDVSDQDLDRQGDGDVEGPALDGDLGRGGEDVHIRYEICEDADGNLSLGL